jgi:hypothetical protein
VAGEVDDVERAGFLDAGSLERSAALEHHALSEEFGEAADFLPLASGKGIISGRPSRL